MTWPLVLAHVGLPLVGALQRYAVAYGYQGLSKREAFHSAEMAFMALALVSAFVALVRVLP